MKQSGCSRQDFKKAWKITGWMALMILPLSVFSQKTLVTDSTDPEHRTVVAGPEYKAGGIYQFLWGKHYRKEWTTPVKVPVIHLEKEYGGLVPMEQGGGRQTKTLRLKDSRGKQYVLRSIDKNYAGALPEIIQGTFLEDLSKDIVSTAHPYSSITIPGMISAAGVYHTNPRIVFVPYSPVLGKYNEEFANMLCLFEERPVDNQEDAANFGNSKDVKGTEKMFEKIFEDNDKRVDQRAFVRARLFDMFLGDWGRHDDQWRWAEFDSADYKIYRPIPRDRDQAYTKFDGFLLSAIMGNDKLDHMQTFGSKIKDVNKFNFPARHLDRQLSNEVSRQEWIDIAKQLKQALTDQVIENGIRQLPPEVFPISGPSMIANLKSRRNALVDDAIEYYEFLSDEIEIVGTEKSELFLAKHLNDRETELSVYDLNKDGEPKKRPFYSRIISNKETEEIRLYGLQGNDIFKVEGASNDLKIRVIGGEGKDSVINNVSKKLTYYDNREENIAQGNIRKKFSRDSANNAYNYTGFNYNSSGVILMPSYSNVRGIHILAGYGYTKEKWRKEPFGWKQSVKGYYSLTNKSWGAEYEGQFTELIGKWNMALNGSYDEKLKYYYFGIGNETVFDKEKLFYEWFSKEINASVGLNRLLNRHHFVSISGFYRGIKAVKDTGTYLIKKLPNNDSSIYNNHDFVGALASYKYHNLNNEVLPTKGVDFIAAASYSQNLKISNRHVNHYEAMFGFYLPFSKSISIAMRTGAATLSGTPEFYQLNWIGGGATLRGYNRQRFFGKTSFYNGTDLRWFFKTRNYLFNGTLGLIAFFDNGRVWQPGENSNKWHTGYGGGFLISPYNKLALTIYYGVSQETNRIHIRLARLF